MKRMSLGVLVALLSACGSSGSIVACPTTSTLTYDNFGKGFMTSYCTRCHASNLGAAARSGARSDQNFDTLAGVQAHLSEVNMQAGETASGSVRTAMPNDSVASPTEAQRKQLGEWLSCGAK